jgi:hypothetical protein
MHNIQPHLQHLMFRLYSRVQRFWPLKYVNRNLEASHLPQVCWKLWVGRGGRGREGANLIAFFLPSSSGPHAGWALPPRSTAKTGGGYCTHTVNHKRDFDHRVIMLSQLTFGVE